MIILDTNVLSALMRPAADRAVVDWLNRQPTVSVWTTSVTILEVWFGLKILAPGKRRVLLMGAFEKLINEIGGRVVSFDSAAANHASDLLASRHRKGRPADLRDTMIAGIVIAHRATLATRDIRHFDDLPVSVINPWDS